MNHQLYEHLGYVPESSFEESPIRASGSENGRDKAGAGPGTPNSEFGIFETSPAQLSFTNTPPPPRRSILKPTGFMTPGEKKKVGFKNSRKSLSCDVTPRACSPAYRGRNSITREEMADIAFCLEKTLNLSSKNNSPSVPIDQEPVAGSSRSENNGNSFGGSSKLENKVEGTFQLSTLITQLSSPSKRSFSHTQINRLGLQSTPTATTSCNMASPVSPYSSPLRMQEQQ